MNDRVYLMGAEAVEQAGRMMLTAAQDMARAANSMAESAHLMQQTQKEMDYTLLNHQRFLNGWVERLRVTLEEVLPAAGEPLEVRLVDNEEDAEGRSEMPTMPAPEPGDTDGCEGSTD